MSDTSMSYYFVANIKIKDQAEYKIYLKEVDNVFSKFNGRYLAVDDHPKILEGEWDYTRVVIIEFKTKSDFNRWYNSKEYQAILEYRIKASESDTILIKGK